MKAERPDQIFVLQQLRKISKQVEAENGRRANLVVWSSTFSTHRQIVIDGRPVQGNLVVLVQFEITPEALANFSPGLELVTTLG